MMNRNDYIEKVTPTDPQYSDVLAIAILEGVVSTDAKPASLSYANRVWFIEAAEPTATTA